MIVHIDLHMVQVLISIDPKTAARLEKVAPARSRMRSEFIRAAIRKALWELEERQTARNYARTPDTGLPVFDAALWEQPAAGSRARRAK